MMTVTGEFVGVRPTAELPSTHSVARFLAITMVLVAAVATPTAIRRATLAESSFAASFGPITSHHGRVRAEVVRAPAQMLGDSTSWIVKVETRAGRGVAHARLAASTTMPEVFGHSESPARTVRYLGRGQYQIDGVRMDRAGWWNLGLVIRHRGSADSLAFNVIVPRSRVGRAQVSRSIQDLGNASP
jgi:hypothetical protein